MKKISILSLFSLFLILWACNGDNSGTTDCTGVVASYSATVKDILNSSCALSGCHTSQNPQSNIDLSTYDKAKLNGAKASFLCSIKHESGCKPMPDGSPKLTDTEIKILDCWASNGFPLN